MMGNLNSIPAELQVAILSSCDDLDDAVCLSQVCRELRKAFQIDRRRIEKRIITTSHVHGYDFCLSKLLALREDLAPLYNLDRRIPDMNKPRVTDFETCLRTEDGKEGSTDEEIQRIALRWKRFSFLRGLYVDDDVSQEFDRFRTAFASGLTPEVGAIMVLPGFKRGIIETSHVNRVQFTQNNRFSSDFKARFHKILCLHSMAIVGVHFAKVGTAVPDPVQEDHDVAEMIDHLWIKEDVLAGGKKTGFDLDTQLDGLEIYDFLYMFLLRKILPYYNLASWIGNDAGHHPFSIERDQLELNDWYLFLRECRQVLQPDDLVDLIENWAWRGPSSWPPNKSMYLRIRGIFEEGRQNELGFDWDAAFERSSMWMGLFSSFENNLLLEMYAEEACGWDLIRLRLGSPFLENSFRAYQDAIIEFDEERKRKAIWDDAKMAWSHDGANIGMPT